MKVSMFEYSKMILDKVSFNRNLFWKEYRKFKRMLSEHESMQLKIWVRQYLAPQ